MNDQNTVGSVLHTYRAVLDISLCRVLGSGDMVPTLLIVNI